MTCTSKNQHTTTKDTTPQNIIHKTSAAGSKALDTYLCFIVQLWKDRTQQVSDEGRLVVRGRIEGHQGHTPDVQVRIFQSLQKFADGSPKQDVNWLWLIGNGEFHSCEQKEN